MEAGKKGEWCELGHGEQEGQCGRDVKGCERRGSHLPRLAQLHERAECVCRGRFFRREQVVRHIQLESAVVPPVSLNAKERK